MPQPRTLDRKILPDDLPRIVQLYKDRNTQVDIGIEYGVDHSTIRYYLVRLGLVIPGKYNWRRSLKRSPPFGVLSRSMIYRKAENEKPTKTYKEYCAESDRQSRQHVMLILQGNEHHVCANIGDGGYL